MGVALLLWSNMAIGVCACAHAKQHKAIITAKSFFIIRYLRYLNGLINTIVCYRNITIRYCIIMKSGVFTGTAFGVCRCPL